MWPTTWSSSAAGAPASARRKPPGARAARVALVTDGPIGGDCTFVGCPPSKTLTEPATSTSTGDPSPTGRLIWRRAGGRRALRSPACGKARADQTSHVRPGARRPGCSSSAAARSASSSHTHSPVSARLSPSSGPLRPTTSTAGRRPNRQRNHERALPGPVSRDRAGSGVLYDRSSPGGQRVGQPPRERLQPAPRPHRGRDLGGGGRAGDGLVGADRGEGRGIVEFRQDGDDGGGQPLAAGVFAQDRGDQVRPRPRRYWRVWAIAS